MPEKILSSPSLRPIVKHGVGNNANVVEHKSWKEKTSLHRDYDCDADKIDRGRGGVSSCRNKDANPKQAK